jgi:hypothetical protein
MELELVVWDLAEFLIAVVVAWLCGFGVTCAVDRASPQYPEAPNGIEPAKWIEIANPKRAGGKIGTVERLLILAAFWAGEPTLIGAWLVFKIAAKWETWRNIIQVPATLGEPSEVDGLIVRRALGNHIMARFLVGALANIFAGFIAWKDGSNAFEVWTAICAARG